KSSRTRVSGAVHARGHRVVGQSRRVRYAGMDRRPPCRRSLERLRRRARRALYAGGRVSGGLDPPRKLVQTWQMKCAPRTPSAVTYLLEKIPGGTRLTVRHAGIIPPEQRNNIGAGWRSSFDQLAQIMSDRAK